VNTDFPHWTEESSQLWSTTPLLPKEWVLCQRRENNSDTAENRIFVSE